MFSLSIKECSALNYLQCIEGSLSNDEANKNGFSKEFCNYLDLLSVFKDQFN